MTGRRLPTAIKELRGTFAINPKRRPPAEPKAAVSVPPCPAHLKGESRREWNRVTAELLMLRVMTDADRSAVQKYAEAWGQQREYERIVKRDGGPVIMGQKGQLYEHPANRMAFRCSEQILKYLIQLGLTPVARSRVQVTQEAKPTRMRRQR